MNIVIPAFPGDLPNMVLQARSVGDMAEISDIDWIYVILIMHRNDKDNYAAVEDIIEQLIAPLFGSLAPYVKVIRYGDLFPGSEGHSNSATAKQASAAAFAGRYVGIGDILVLENGEGIADYDVSDCGSAADEPRPSPDISDRYRSIRCDQARQLLNIPSEGTVGGKSSCLRSYLVSGDALADIDKSLLGGLSTVARRMIDGEIICDLREIYCAWAESNHSAPHRERVPAGPNSIANGLYREGASLRYAASDALRTRFGTGMDDGGLSSLMHQVAERVAKQEDWDAGLASRAIGLVNELRHRRVNFVQVGANDGEYLDPISPFMDGGNWSGLVIEPVSHYFSRLEQRYARFANVMPLQCAVGSQSAQRTIYYVDDGILGDGKETGGPEWLKGIASFSIEHLLRHGVARESLRQLSVDVRKGSDILEQYFIGPIDLLVVDVEGAEREVLESFDLQHQRPTCIIFECEHLGVEDEIALKELLRKSGYRVWWIRPDAVAMQSPSDLETAFRNLMMEDRGARYSRTEMDERFSAARNRKSDVTEAYSYPDNEDRILSSFVDQQEPYPGYWAESEERALARLGAHLANLLPARHLVRAIDAGCGPGRALPWITTFAERITAVDPDRSRLAEARKYKDLPDTQLSFENIPISEADGGPYQLIVCNHVVQHVSTEMAQLILSKFRELAAPDAILVMSFSRSPVGEESYGIAHMNGSVSSFEKIDRSAFDSLASAGGSPGYLPVRMIDPEIFAADALAVGWEICWSWTYHSMGQPGAEPSADRDEMINDSPLLLRQSEGDIYVVMHRKDLHASTFA